MGKIAILMPEIISHQDYELLSGVYSQAKRLGYDLIVLTGVLNSQRELRYDSYIAGLENIYSLVCMCRFDGIIYAAERFRTPELTEKIISYLRQTDAPCIVLGDELKDFTSLYANEYDSVFDLTTHLIKDHGCKKLYCITGVPEHRSSQERLRAFIDACSENGVTVTEDDVFYGYFWKDVPTKIGEDIACGRIEKPDGIVCTSDIMAVALIESLKEHGLRVPEDIAVTGFDGGLEAIMNEPSITTVCGRDKQFGSNAMLTLHNLITGGSEPIQRCQSIYFGRSCGCSYERIAESNPREGSALSYLKRKFSHMIESRPFIATDHIHSMSRSSTLQELSDSISSVAHMIRDWDRLDVCLCSDWRADIDNPDKFRQYGFSDEMFMLLSKRRGSNERAMYSFPTRSLLPALNAPHDPHLIVMTSLHCDGQILGFCSVGYTDPKDIEIDEYLISFCDSISSALISLQKKMYAKHFSEQFSKLSVADPISGMLNKRGFMIHLPEILSRNRYSGTRSFLLLITYYPDEFALGDPSNVIADIIRNACGNSLCARIQDKIYSVLLSVSSDGQPDQIAEELILSIEKSMRTRFAVTETVSLPEFITETSEITDYEMSIIDEQLSSCISALSDKKTAAQNNFIDYREQLYHIRRNILSQPQLEWEITELAKEMAISRSHFQRLYKQLFGVTAKDDMISARIKRAMQLLANTDMRIQEVAEQCGYNNESHFMRQFKDKCGMTAAQYRKTNK